MSESQTHQTPMLDMYLFIKRNNQAIIIHSYDTVENKNASTSLKEASCPFQEFKAPSNYQKYSLLDQLSHRLAPTILQKQSEKKSEAIPSLKPDKASRSCMRLK